VNEIVRERDESGAYLDIFDFCYRIEKKIFEPKSNRSLNLCRCF